MSAPALESYQSTSGIWRWWPAAALTVIFGFLIVATVSNYNHKYELRVLSSNRISALSLKLRVHIDKAESLASAGGDLATDEDITEFILEQTDLSARFALTRSTLETVLTTEDYRKMRSGERTWDNYAEEVFRGLDTGITGKSGMTRFRTNLAFRLKIYKEKLIGLRNTIVIAESLVSESLQNYRFGLTVWLFVLGISYVMILLFMQKHPLLSFRSDPSDLPGFLVSPGRPVPAPRMTYPAQSPAPPVAPEQANSITESPGVLIRAGAPDQETLSTKSQGAPRAEASNHQDVESKPETTPGTSTVKPVVNVNQEAQMDFLSRLSHEIRTPLSGITGMVELLSDTPVNREQQELISRLKSSNQNLLQLIDSMISFPGKERREHDFIAHTQFRPAIMVEDAITLFTEPCQSRGIELESAFSEFVPAYIAGNRQKVQQILVNLISNAVRFTDTGGIKVMVDLESETDSQATLKFDVIDSGRGIPEKTRAYLFKPVQELELEKAGYDTVGGHGLGLAITHDLVQEMGGRISYAPSGESGQGSHFSFSIPFEKPGTMRMGPVFPRFQNVDLLAFAPPPLLAWALESDSRLMKFHMESTSDFDVIRKRIANQTELNERKLVILFDGDNITPDQLDDTAQCLADFNSPEDDNGLQIYMVVISTIHLDPRRFERFENRADFMTIYRPIRLSALSIVLNQIKDGSALNTNLIRNARRIIPESSLRILTVEDAAVSREVFSRQLHTIGLDYLMASTGEEALELLERFPFHVVLMDCNLPGMDGFQTTRLMRTNPACRDLLIIGITANANPDIKKRCLEAGMDAHLVKPVALVDLENAIYSRFPDYLF